MMEEKEKILNVELKKNSCRLAKILLDFIINVLITSEFLWLAINLVYLAFNIQLYLTFLQSISIVFAVSVLFGIGGPFKK